jgi:outer membrane protein, heavy metal efflux system
MGREYRAARAWHCRVERTAALLLVACALGLAGCAPLVVPEAAELNPQTLVQGRATLTFPLSATAPDLATLTRFAWSTHPALKAARADCEVARAEADLAFRPQPIELDTAIEQRSSGGGSDATPGGGLGITFSLEPESRRQLRRAAASRRARATCLRYTEVAWTVRSALRSAWAALQLATLRQQALTFRVGLLDTLVERLEARENLGEDDGFAAATARLDRAEARVELARVAADLTAARGQLAGHLGLPASGLDQRDLVVDGFAEPPGLAELPASLLRLTVATSHGELLALLEGYLAAEAEVQLAAGRRWPELRLSPALLFDQSQVVWQLASAFVLPLASQVEPPLRLAAAEREAAAARFTARQHEVLTAVELGLRQYAADYVVWSEGRALLRTAQVRRDRLQRLEDSGEMDAVTLLRAELELAAVKLAVVDLAGRAQQSLGALEAAAELNLDGGELLQPDTLEAAPTVAIP